MVHIGTNDLKPGTPANRERVGRIQKYLSGKYQTAGVLDVDYQGKQHGTFAGKSAGGPATRARHKVVKNSCCIVS